MTVQQASSDKAHPGMAKKAARHRAYTLHIVSDLTGGLADHVVSSVLTQFPNLEFTKAYHTFQDTEAKLRQTVSEFGKGPHLVFYALVDPTHKRVIQEACDQRDISSFDLTGSMVQFIADQTGVSPVNELSRLHRVDSGYFRRVDAIEFTLQHDDGRNLQTLHEAEIVLIGLSRVSKSPTAVYLGSLGYKTANISIDLTVGFPKALNRVKRRTVALTIQPRLLQRMRQARAEQWGMTDTDYSDQRAINREVMEAEQAYEARGYPVIDITDETIEMIATRVLDTLKPRQR
jgi:regulator of PEP synthase PpsR (kinase-PPPase family)